ncbi:MAG: ABC transporter permease [Hyphomicrobiales bacterium]|nr:MAG: ABC transporter permease [Hyphomicrobiales bacterium]
MNETSQPSNSVGNNSGQNHQNGQSDGAAAPDADLPLIVTNKTTPNLDNKPPSLLRRIFRVLRFLPLVLIFGATVGVVALYFQPPGLQKLMGFLQLEPGGGTTSPIAVPANPRPAPDMVVEAPKPEIRQIVGLGKLLPEGDVRTVAPPFGAGDARIATLFVKEGSKVAQGDTLAGLDNEQNIVAIIENAKAIVAAREATLNQVRSSVQASQNEARAALQRAKSALQNFQSELDRAQALFDRGFTTRAVLDQKQSARDQAQGDVERLTATLSRYVTNSINEQPDVIVAARNVDAAVSDLKRAKSDLSKSLVYAPISGTILKIHVHPGERPGSKGILDIGNIDKMTADIEVYQTEIGAVVLGASVELTAEALSRPLKGIVTKIGLEVGTQTLVGSSPAANTDARVVTVTATLDKASSEAAKRFTNLQVLARIEVTSE